MDAYDDPLLIRFLEYGFPLGYDRATVNSDIDDNHMSALNFPQPIDSFILDSVKDGSLAGPVHSQFFKCEHIVSPLMSAPKKDSGSRRIIMDCSYPLGNSVNDGIPCDHFIGLDPNISLPTPLNLRDFIVEQGTGSYIYVIDLKGAYRQLRLDPLDWPRTMLKHHNNFFFDLSLPFGARYSARSQTHVVEAVLFILRKFGVKALCYVDDFTGVRTSYLD